MYWTVRKEIFICCNEEFDGILLFSSTATDNEGYQQAAPTS
jgi:hypothetical protein